VGVHWRKLESLCRAKLELEKTAVASEEPSIIDFKSNASIFESINHDLIQSLQKRRSSRKSLEVMIVEDDPFSQKLVSNILNDHYSVHVTSDGYGALMSYVNFAPDVLFLDIGLPDIDGHEVLEKIFIIDPNAYVVMLSGNGDKENIMKAVTSGAKGFVGKPFTQEKLFQYIEKSPYVQEKTSKILN